MADLSVVLFGSSPAARRPHPGPYAPTVRTDWATGLDPTVVAKATELQRLAAQEGIEVGITAGHRTHEEQSRLYAQGRTAPGAIVTYAPPGTSRHESGRAIDVVPLKDGKPDWKSPHWGRLGVLGKQLGFEWGGDWRGFTDRPHFQLPAGPAASPGAAESGTLPGLERVTPAFRTKVDQVARRLRMDPQHLLTVMSFETGGTFDPAVRNRAGSGATGLLQFMPETARSLGTTTDELARMTPERQLDYVERYLRPYAGRLRTPQDAYMAVLYPAAIGKPASQVLFEEGSRAYAYNQGLDPDQTGRVTIGSTLRAVRRHLASLVTPARAEAAPVSPARPPGGRGQQLSDDLFGPGPQAASPSPPAPPASGTLAGPFTGASSQPAAPQGRGVQVSDELFGPPPAGPGPRSPALAQEQAAAAEQPWWQRAVQTVGAASPEMALYAPELPQVEQAKAEMSPAERAELRRLEGQAGTGANVGELVGQTIGSAVLPGAGTAIGGTLGAVTGKTAETLLQEGRLPTWKEIGTEAAWSALPEAAESLGRLGLRTLARGTRGGQLIRFDEAARRARALPEVFEAQTREQVGDAFDAVRQSGVQLDTTALRQEIQSLRPGKYADVMAELRRLDREMKTGSRYQQVFQHLRQTGGVQVTGLPIGDLQQLRSALRQRIDQLEHTEARQLLRDVQRAVDDAIDQGIARGRTAAGQTPEQLQQARREWARVRASEDMGDLIERTITTTPDLSMASFNMRQFADAMRRNTGDLAQSVNRSLDQVPGARARFLREMDEIAQLYRTAELPMADVFGIWRLPGAAMVRQWISQALMTDTGRQVFRQAMIAGRGRLSLNGFAAAVNAGRREVGLAPLVLPGREGEPPASAEAPTPGPGG